MSFVSRAYDLTAFDYGFCRYRKCVVLSIILVSIAQFLSIDIVSLLRGSCEVLELHSLSMAGKPCLSVPPKTIAPQLVTLERQKDQ